MRYSYVYILASKKNGTLYIGVTADILKRMYEHRQENGSQFTSAYSVYMLVHYEVFEDITTAIAREKQLKQWHRQWKINLIQQHNPEWKDLYEVIIR